MSERKTQAEIARSHEDDRMVTMAPELVYLAALDYTILLLEQEPDNRLKVALAADLHQLRNIIIGAPYLWSPSAARHRAVFDVGHSRP